MHLLGVVASSYLQSTTDFNSIAKVIVGSGGALDVTFSDIPSTYTHLQIRFSLQTKRSGYTTDDVYYIFNNDSGSNYSYHNVTGGVGVTAQVNSGGSVNQTLGLLQWVSSTTGNAANVKTGGVMDILDYKNTSKYKTVRTLHGYDINTNASYAGTVSFSSGNWRNTNAINSIKFTTDSGTGFSEFSHFALYGIKA